MSIISFDDIFERLNVLFMALNINIDSLDSMNILFLEPILKHISKLKDNLKDELYELNNFIVIQGFTSLLNKVYKLAALFDDIVMKLDYKIYEFDEKVIMFKNNFEMLLEDYETNPNSLVNLDKLEVELNSYDFLFEFKTRFNLLERRTTQHYYNQNMKSKYSFNIDFENGYFVSSLTIDFSIPI
jgi:hypothetical protein